MSLYPEEYPQTVIKDISQKHLNMARAVRDCTGVPMVPSPIPEAHVRYAEYNPHEKGKGSRHRVCDGIGGVIRQSDAGDYFLVHNDHISQFWLRAQHIHELGGFGVYFDTKLKGKPRVMVHLDNRQKRTLWVCPIGKTRKYIYFNSDPVGYLEALGEGFRAIKEGEF